MKEDKTKKSPCGCRYPGTAVDLGDNDTTTEQEVKERTEVLDSNPRIDPTDIEEIPS